MSTYLTEQELADRLKVTKRTLQRWRNELPPIGPAVMSMGTDGKTLRYRMQDIEAWERRSLSGGFVPEHAKKAMLRAASTFDIILNWKGINDQARATLEEMRDDLRKIISEKPQTP